MSQHKSNKSIKSIKSIKDNEAIKRFLLKYTIIASSITVFIGSYLKDFLQKIVNALVDPFFSIDLNSDGKPDLKQLDMYSMKMLGHKFPLGQLLIEIIRIIITIMVIYIVIKILIRYTNLIDLE